MLEIHSLFARNIANFSYQHTPGTQTLVLGASGSGKSTLLNIILGSLKADSGMVSNRFVRTGMVYQDLNLIQRLTATENAFLVLKAENYSRFHSLMQELSISHLENKIINTLSAGERQRVAVAIALADQPDLLLADEPTSNLDPETADLVLSVILRHTRSLLIVSHDHRFLRHFSTVINIGSLPT